MPETPTQKLAPTSVSVGLMLRLGVRFRPEITKRADWNPCSKSFGVALIKITHLRYTSNFFSHDFRIKPTVRVKLFSIFGKECRRAASPSPWQTNVVAVLRVLHEEVVQLRSLLPLRTGDVVILDTLTKCLLFFYWSPFASVLLSCLFCFVNIFWSHFSPLLITKC